MDDNNSSNEVMKLLQSFISDKAGIDEERIIPTALIEEELKITGDDAVELIVAYGKHFNVDVSKFMAAKYFDGEGIKIISNLFYRITKRPKRERSLMVSDLINGIIHGRLDEEIINGK